MRLSTRYGLAFLILQVLAGDVSQAALTHEAFHSLWTRFRVLPERYDVSRGALHSSMNYYPLRYACHNRPWAVHIRSWALHSSVNYLLLSTTSSFPLHWAESLLRQKHLGGSANVSSVLSMWQCLMSAPMACTVPNPSQPA